MKMSFAFVLLSVVALEAKVEEIKKVNSLASSRLECGTSGVCGTLSLGSEARNALVLSSFIT